MLIRVTPDHVARGRPRQSGSCPVALAIKDALAPGCCVTVTVEFVRVWRPGEKTRRFGLPFAVGEAIALFDREREMAAFEFQLDLESTPWAKGATT